MESIIIKKIILRKLINRNCWGGKHTSGKNLIKGIPKHLRGFSSSIIKELVNDGVLLRKPSTGEIHYSLNPDKKKRIPEILEE